MHAQVRRVKLLISFLPNRQQIFEIPKRKENSSMIQATLLALLINFSVTAFAETPPVAAAPVASSSDEQLVQSLWGKEFAQCFLTKPQYEEFEKKWTRYRVLVRARYNILAKSYFANKMPKIKPVEIDKAFQYQALEPMTCPGLTDEERIAGVQKALSDSMESEGFKFADAKKFFELDEMPKKLEDYLDLFNDPSLISMPYSLQDGFDQLYRSEWDRMNSKPEVEYSYVTKSESRTIKLSKTDLRTIDAIARTMWAELSGCETVDGHYEMLAKIVYDRHLACEKDPLINRRHCRPDPQGQALTQFEKVIAAPSQFSSWIPGSYGMIEVTNTAGKKIGSQFKNQIGFQKFILPNGEIQKTLCPNPEGLKTDDAKINLLKKAYLTALEFYRDPKQFSERWKWPKGVHNGIRYYSYGLSFNKGRPKNVHSIIDSAETPPKEINFKKTASANCPVPYFYEVR